MMSASRSAKCLFARTHSLILPTRPTQNHRPFHASTARPARRRRPHYPSIKASELALLNQAAEAQIPRYQDVDQELLAQKFTPGQLDAIRAAEATIDPRDVITQGAKRTDAWRLPYRDDLTSVDPVIDSAPKLTMDDIPGDPNTKRIRRTNMVERDESLARITTENMAKLYPDGMPDGVQDSEIQESTEAALMQAILDPRMTYTSDNPGMLSALADPRHSVVQPSLPRLENRMARQTRRLRSQEPEDPRQKRLLQYLDWTKPQLRGLRLKTLVAHSVTNQTRMGKIRSMYFLSIAGNGDGLLGIGEGKSTEPDEGRKQSHMAAIRNMRPVPRYENRTTFGDLERKVGATVVQLYARPPGFGLRTQHLIFELARAAGLHDLAARTPRSRNKMNVIKATWEALTSQRLPDEIARARGKKLVDVRKVYYGGMTH